MILAEGRDFVCRWKDVYLGEVAKMSLKSRLMLYQVIFFIGSMMLCVSGAGARASDNLLGTTTFIISTTRVASGLSKPLFVTTPAGDVGRLFIVEQHTGRIKILNLDTGLLNPSPFLDIDGLSTGNEQGLLGLAFHPDYADNGFFFVNFTQTDGTTNIRRYRVSANNPDIADPSTAMTLMTYT